MGRLAICSKAIGGWLVLLSIVGCSNSSALETASGTRLRATGEPGVQIQAIDEPLIGVAPSVTEGRNIFVNRDLGHCVLCHRVASLEAPFQGDLGPDLSGVGSRLSPGQIRLRVVDSSVINPLSVMPPYHRVQGLWRVAEQQLDQPILSAGQVEHLVAYLLSLTEDSKSE